MSHSDSAPEQRVTQCALPVAVWQLPTGTIRATLAHLKENPSSPKTVSRRTDKLWNACYIIGGEGSITYLTALGLTRIT